MDYLEGMLFHSWWGDTDYASRKHTGTWFFYSIVMSLLLFVATLELNLTLELTLANYSSVFLTSLIVLFILTPLLGKIYYKTSLLIRIPILIALTWKYLSLFALVIINIAERLLIPETMTINSILNWGNESVGDFLTETTALYGVSGLFIGSFMIALIAIVVALIVAAILIFAPMLILYVFNLCQYLWDQFIIFLFEKGRKLYINYNEKNAKSPSDPSISNRNSNTIEGKEVID